MDSNKSLQGKVIVDDILGGRCTNLKEKEKEEERKRLAEQFAQAYGWFAPPVTTPVLDGGVERKFSDIVSELIEESEHRQQFSQRDKEIFDQLKRGPVLTADGCEPSSDQYVDTTNLSDEQKENLWQAFMTEWSSRENIIKVGQWMEGHPERMICLKDRYKVVVDEFRDALSMRLICGEV